MSPRRVAGLGAARAERRRSGPVRSAASRARPRILTLAAAGALLAASAMNPAAVGQDSGETPLAVEFANETIGYPSFSGDDEPVPPLPEPFRVGGTLAAGFEADLAAGDGTDFWMDRMLARHGRDPSGDWLFTRGRAAFMKTHQPGVLGFGGQLAYWESIDDRPGYRVELSADGTAIDLREDVPARMQAPSHWRSEFDAGAGLTVVQRKFITEANVLVTDLEFRNAGASSRALDVAAVSPYAAEGTGDELTGAASVRNDLTTLYPRFSGAGLTAQDGALRGTLEIPAGGTAHTSVRLGLVTEEIPASSTEYEAVRAAEPGEAFRTHVQEYNRWWGENLPYLDVPSADLGKTLYYRWWLLRYNFLDADIPGDDYQFPTAIEGVLGYNNSIALTTGMFVDDLKYLRDPAWAYGTWVSTGETSRGGRFRDNPGDPENWSNSYTQYLAEAAWQSYLVHGGPDGVVRNLARYAEDDVRDQLDTYDHDDNGLIEYDWGAMTGNDADAVSFHWRAGQLDRAESGYVFAGAQAASAAYELLGEDEKAAELDAIAERIRAATLEHLWDPTDRMIKHRHVATDALVPWKEGNNYIPFAVGLMPNEPEYVDALRLLADRREYPVFPFFTANQADKTEAAQQGHPGTNNFSVINAQRYFDVYSSALRNYPSEHVTPELYEKLLMWNAWSHYVGGDNRWPDQNEFWADGDPEAQRIGYRSWIHHTMLGTTNYTIIEDVAGLRPRTDTRVELSPIDLGWDHFAVENLRYRGGDLAIVWDEPGDGVRHYGQDVPEGYSLYLDGERVLTLDALTPVIYDPATGEAEFPGEPAEVLHQAAASVTEAQDVTYADDSRVVDVFAKAGRDIGSTRDAANVAEGASAPASYSAPNRGPAGAVDGATINEPFWSTEGSSENRHSLDVELGATQTVDEVRLFFRNDKQPRGHREPALYTVSYRDGDQWREVAQPVRTPAYPRANHNEIRFAPVETSALRVDLTGQPGHPIGLKEFQAFATGEPPAESQDAAPQVQARVDAGHRVPGQARLIGVVKDDGLPAGELSSTWSVVAGPEAATVIFEDVSAPTTVARFGAEGVYTLALTATDGAQETSRQLVVEVDAVPERRNVAPAATASASFSANGTPVTAVNDGRDPGSSTERPFWGTWPQRTGQWVEYSWESPVRVDGSELYFFRDVQPGAPDGIAVPRSWRLEYWDTEAEEFVPVADADEYGVAADRYNATEFAPVTTTRLRAALTNSPGLSLGIVQWKVYAQQPSEIRPVHVPTTVGALPELPVTATLVYPGGATAEAEVAWPAVDPGQVADGGSSFTLTGITDVATLPAQATVWVRASDAVQITSIDPWEIDTLVGVAPNLPPTVVATYNDGSKDSSIPVVWDEADPDDYAEAGEFEVAGVVEGAGQAAVARVIVG
ncbi:discoidin domain-containing protein [Actinoalloteichus fjordicus]|uniref:F5/8 type C domain-containing protein n=1 Tax=Actinoalloteichus fjordicus TaxID=1612552 RepID=A0AAC9LCU1_9PSEU|nr:discoidin domain-containing protein [Actinoalloteichus fjordicus]APU15603.1 hypothetical protein UA74_17875 [Actinoalloteichus fjordicus]